MMRPFVGVRPLYLSIRQMVRLTALDEETSGGPQLFRWDVRAKLLLYSLIIILPIVIFASNVVQQKFAAMKAQLARDEQSRAERLGLQVSLSLRSTEAVLRMLAATPTVQRQTGEMSSLLGNSVALNPSLEAIVAVDRDGTPLAATITPETMLRGPDFEAFLRQVLTTGKQDVAGPVYSGPARRPQIVVAVPVRQSDGKIAGALYALVPIARLVEDAQARGDDRDRVLAIINQQQQPVLYLDRGDWVERDTSGLEPLRVALQGGEFSGEYYDPYYGKTWIGGAAPVPEFGWAVLSSQPAIVIYPAGMLESFKEFLVLLLVIALVITLSNVLARIAVRPLRRLTRAAHLIARGDLDQRVDLLTGDELEELASSFNAMSASLATSFARLKMANAIAQKISSDLDVNSVLQEIAAGAAQLLGAPSGAIVVWDEAAQAHRPLAVFNLPPELVGADLPPNGLLASLARQSGQTVLLDQEGARRQADAGLGVYDFKAALSVPLLAEKGAIGALMVLATMSGREFHDSDVELLSSFANHAAIAITNARLHSDNAQRLKELNAAKAELTRNAAELRRLLVQTIHAQEDERARIAIELHDGVTPLVVGGLYEVQAARQVVRNNPEALNGKFELVQQLLDQAIKEMRRVMLDLRPVDLEHGGLVVALQRHIASFQTSTHLPCTFEVIGLPGALRPDVEAAAFRIVQEALHNIRKHAAASSVRVTLTFSPRSLNVVVADNGKGFDLRRASRRLSGHLGLVGMRERALSVGGMLTVRTKPGAGTTILLKLPVERSVARADAPRFQVVR